MNKLIPYVCILFIVFSFKTKPDDLRDLEYELNGLIRSFTTNANMDNCESYFQDIDSLKDKIEDAKKEQEAKLGPLKILQQRTEALYDFASILTSCESTNNELKTDDFSRLIKVITIIFYRYYIIDNQDFNFLD